MRKKLLFLTFAAALCTQVALAQQSKTDPSLEFNPHWFGQMTVSGSGSAVNSFKVKQNGAALSSPFYTVCLPD